MIRTGLDQLRFAPRSWERPCFIITQGYLRAEQNLLSFSKKEGRYGWLCVRSLHGNWHLLPPALPQAQQYTLSCT